jgi:hypothetical protein
MNREILKAVAACKAELPMVSILGWCLCHQRRNGDQAILYFRNLA